MNTRRTLTVNRSTTSRRMRFSPPACGTTKPDATHLRCVLDADHTGRPHFADGVSWDDEEAVA